MRSLLRGTLAAAAALTLLALDAAAASAQNWRTVTMSRQKSGQERLDVRVEYGVGSLRLHRAESGLLYRMHLRYDDDGLEPVADLDDGRLHLGVAGRGRDLHMGKDRDGGEAEIQLAEDLPLELRLDLGAVRANVDLGGISVTGLELRTGASETRLDVSSPNGVPMKAASFEVGAADFEAVNLGNLDAAEIEVSAGVGAVRLEFGGAWRRDADVAVDMGLGSLELRFPRGLGVKIERDTFLTSFDPQGLVKRGDAYYSPHWDESDHRVTIAVSAAFGSVDVVWVR